MSYGVFIKGSKRRTADTPADRVNLIARGWQLAQDVPQPPAPNPVKRPEENQPPPPPPRAPANDVPPADAEPEDDPAAEKRGKTK